MVDVINSTFSAVAAMSPITVIGAIIAIVASLAYLFKPLPDFLLVVLTAVLYAAVPLLQKMH